jgi:hypothetical protein
VRHARRDFAAFAEYAFGLELGRHHRLWAEEVEAHPRLVVLAPVENGKSTLLSIAYPLWRLGRDPNLRVALISETFAQATRPLAAIREAIVRNPRVREVFPGLRPNAGSREKWSDSEIVVERTAALKDPSVLALGVMGPLLGARVDLAVLDDVTSWENSYTGAQRAKVVAWFKSTLVGRVTPAGKIIVVGTPWAADDLLGQLQASSEYRSVRTPAISEAGEPLWPEVWPLARLHQRRCEIGEVEFSRQMLLQVVSDATSRFKEAWFERAFKAAQDAGAALVDRWEGRRPTFTGVDLGVGQTEAHDMSAIFTLALMPGGKRQVLAIESGRWQAPELVARVKAAHERFRSRVRVESNAAQAYLVQFLRGAGVPVEAHTTGRNKHDPAYGVESLAVELEQGRWIVPDAPATREWMRELIAYSPDGHAGDRVMASWFAREAARAYDGDGKPLPVVIGDSAGRAATSGRYFIERDGDFPGVGGTGDPWEGAFPPNPGSHFRRHGA